jgi:uncharacterized protein (TIGR02270 family)
MSRRVPAARTASKAATFSSIEARVSVSPEEVTLWEIVEEHLDEAAFLYGMRNDRLSVPHYNLDDVRLGPEARLFAHVDALVVGGSSVRERLLIPTIRDDEAEPERVAAAALAMLRSEHLHLSVELLVAALPSMQGARMDALSAALSLAEVPEVPQLLVREVRKEQTPAVSAAMLRILAAYRMDPGETLVRFLQSEDPATAQAAAAVAAAVPRADCLAWCERLIDSDAIETRNEAMDAALVLGSSSAWSVCCHRAQHPIEKDAHALLLCGLLGSSQEQRRLTELLESGIQVSAVLWAMSFSGRADGMQTVMTLLEHPDERIAKLAGETFTAVTGYMPAKQSTIRAHAENRSPSEPADDTFPFTEEDLDADLVPSAADLLPSVDRAAASAWWDGHRGRFTAGSRYMEGEPMSFASVHRALRHGSVRRRQPWALGVSIASGGQYVVSTEAICQRQLAQLERLAHCDPAVLSRLFR